MLKLVEVARRVLLNRSVDVSVHSDARSEPRCRRAFRRVARASILAGGRFTALLSGGSTPRRIYEVLAAPRLRDRIDWSRVEVSWGDERGVRPDHPDSDCRMASSALLVDLVLLGMGGCGVRTTSVVIQGFINLR
jgi:Glucosamine-6-phosphate isomerases/6-phosphogluconolactonase